MKSVEVWRKSSHSGENGSCIEIELSTRGRIRDSKHRQGPTLDVGQEAVDALLESARAGHFSG